MATGMSSAYYWSIGMLWNAALMLVMTRAEVLNVASMMGLPFVGQDNQSGNLIGFFPDYFRHLRTLNKSCRYQFLNSKSPANSDKSWNQLVQVIINQEADIGIGPIPNGGVQNSLGLLDRLEFTGPFSDHHGWTAVMRRPQKPKFSILTEATFLCRPFRVEVWLALAVSFILVAALLGLINLINPYEWRALYQRSSVPIQDRDHLSPLGSIFIAFSTLTWQGYEKTPRSVGARVLLLFWMAFVAVVMVTFTANTYLLYTKISHSKSSQPTPVIVNPLSLLDHVPENTKFGTLESWPIIEVLSKHESPNVRKFGKLLDESGDNVQNLDEGIKRVLDESSQYVLIVDKIIAKYIASDNCDIVLGESINPGKVKGYGFAIRKARSSNFFQSDKLECFKMAVNNLPSDEEAKYLWKKWENSHKYGLCHKRFVLKNENITSPPPFLPIDIYQFFGPLALVALGVVLSILISLLEILVHYISNKLKKVSILGADSSIEEEQRLHHERDDDLRP